MADTADPSGGRHLVRVTLKGKDNETYTGTLILRNLSSLLAGHGLVPIPSPNMTDRPLIGSPGQPADPSGASYYVIAVVLVYGMSIVMLIASHIKRKHKKQIEDKQIHKYLREFQIVKERSSRDSYKTLKRSIMAKLNMHHRNPTYRTLSHAILPMMAVGLPTLKDDRSNSPEVDSSRIMRRASFQVSAFRPVNHGLNGRGRRASEFDISLRTLKLPSRHLGRGSREEINLERHGSFRANHSMGDHLLPSRIEEENPPTPPVTNESTIIDVEEDDQSSPPDTPRKDSTQSTTSNVETEPNDRYFYKPISISKACRVYEIPKTSQSKNVLKHGIHIPLFKPSPTISERPLKALSSDTLDNIEEIDRDTSEKLECHNNGKELTNKDNPSESNKSLDNRMDKEDIVGNVNAADEISPGTRTNTPERMTNNKPTLVSNGDLANPLQTAKIPRGPLATHDRINEGKRSLLARRRFSDKGPIDGLVEGKINVVETNLMSPQRNLNDAEGMGDESRSDHLVRNQRSASVKGCPPQRKPPLHLDVAVSVHQWPNHCQPTSLQPSLRPSHNYIKQPNKRYSWSSPGQSPGEVKPCTSSSGSLSKKDTPSTPDTRSIPCTASYESFPSATSSDSEDVWLVMSRARCTRKQISIDSDDPNYRPLFPDLALHGAGTSPLITPKDLRRFDSTDSSKRVSPRSFSSRSASPATSQTGSDTEKLLHQVTSV